MSEIGIRGIDLFKIAGESISGWIPSWKMGDQKPTRQPFCSLMEERLLCIWNIIPRWSGMDVVISAPPLPQRTRLPRLYQRLSPFTTCLMVMLMCIFPTQLASLRVALSCLQRQVWSGKSAGNAIRQKLKRHGIRCSRARWGLLDWNRSHFTPATTCQSRLLTCPAAALSVFSRVGRGASGDLAPR